MRDECLVNTMELKRISRAAGAVILTVGMVATASAATAATTATKKITCYKLSGKTVMTKQYAAAKCPAGWSTKKPAAPAATGAKSVAFNATYKGDITMVWSSSDVKATEVSGTASDAPAGLAKFSATGGSAPQAQCAAINGSGTFGSGADTLTFKTEKTTGCAANEAAPSAVSVSGTATITGGTGKYKGATGSLKITGSFQVASTKPGTDKQQFTATFVGTVTTK